VDDITDPVGDMLTKPIRMHKFLTYSPGGASLLDSVVFSANKVAHWGQVCYLRQQFVLFIDFLRNRFGLVARGPSGRRRGFNESFEPLVATPLVRRSAMRNDTGRF